MLQLLFQPIIQRQIYKSLWTGHGQDGTIEQKSRSLSSKSDLLYYNEI